MRKFCISVAAALSLLVAGCSILPKPIEFFQKKVTPLPTLTDSGKETQREAAALAAQRAQDTLVAAVSNNVPTEVIVPAEDTATLTKSVSTSLGPPLHPWDGEVKALAENLDKKVAALNQKLDDYRANVQEMAGKKVEGTGLVKVPYLVYLGCVLGGLVLLFVLLSLGWAALKAYSLMNPVAAVGTNAISMGASEVAKAFSQVVAGGEAFKQAVESKFGPGSDTAKTVLDLFKSEHQKAQDSNVQGAIKNLTA